MRGRLPSLLLAVVLVAVAACLAMAAVHAWSAPASDCDNMAGQCLRGRQYDAINGIGLLCACVALWALWSAFATLHRRRIAILPVAVGVLGASLAVAYVAVDPIGHLNHGYTGWLAGVTTLTA